MIFVLVVFFVLVGAGAADAAPVGAAIAAVFKAVAAWQIGGFAVGSFLLKTAASFALSLLTRAKMDQGSQGGLRTETTQAGEGTSGSLVLGKYATGGFMVCPPMTDGHAGKTPNAYLTYVVDLGDAPFVSLDGIWIGDEKVEILPPDPDAARYPDHHRAGGKFADRVWFRFFDGSQTEAYVGLTQTDGNGRPWTSDMIGIGVPYVVMRFKYDRELFQGLPNCLFEVTGIRLYDPRKDSTVGGSGTHRWGDLSTYEPSENTGVQVYNILRGIRMPDGSTWGGTCTADDLPLANWFAGMNECDRLVEGEAQYRSSYEVRIGPEEFGGDSPADVIDELLRGSSGQIAEFGGTYRVRFGAVGLPVAFLTDDDLLVTSEHSLRPFPGLQDICNAVHAQYPEPIERWANKEAPPRYNLEYEAADQGHRLITSLQLPATPYSKQVQRTMLALLKDDRRFRMHEIAVPSDYTAVEVLDAVAWGSEVNGYASGKPFEVTTRADSLLTMVQQLGLRERDSGDYIWTPDDPLPSTTTPPTTVPPPPSVVIQFAVEGIAVPDGAGRPRRAAIAMTWDWDQPNATGIMYEIRPQASLALAGKGSVTGMSEGRHVTSDGVVGNQSYEVRARPITRRPSAWSPWFLAITPDVRVARDEIDQSLLDQVDGWEAWADGTGALLDGIQADMDAETTRVNALVQAARDDLGDDVSALALQVSGALSDANAYTDTSVSEYDLVVQGQFDAVAGQIQQLTAALTSGDLVSNGRFAADATNWTLTSAARVEKAGSSVALVLAAPSDAMVAIGTSSTGSISQALSEFTVDADDRMQLRFAAASAAATRTLSITFDWRDGSGDPVGTPVTQSVTVSPANQWRVYSLQADPPDTAVGAILTINKTQTGVPVYVTALEGSTVNIEIEGRVTTLEAARVTDAAALATYKLDVDSRFGTANGLISTEATTRSSADGALSDRLDIVESASSTQGALIASHATAIADNEASIAQVDGLVEATYGNTQLVRDPWFRYDFRFWQGPNRQLSRIAIRDKSSTSIIFNAMPGPRAFRFQWNEDGLHSLQTVRYEVQPEDVFVLSAWFFKQVGGPTGRIYVQFFDAAGAYLSDGPSLVGSINAWKQLKTDMFSPPADAREARVFVAKGSAAATVNAVYMTGITFQRQTGYDALSSSRIGELAQSYADVNGGFSSFKQTVESTLYTPVTGITARVQANATAISQRYTKVEANQAIANAVQSAKAELEPQIGNKATASSVTALTTRVKDTEDGLTSVSNAVTRVTGEVGNLSGEGLLRINVTANPAGVTTRLGLRAIASQANQSHSSAIFLEANTNGTSSVGVVANSFYVTDSPAPGGVRTVMFRIANGQAYLRSAVIEDLTVGTLKIADGAVTSMHTAQSAGGPVTQYQTWQTMLTLTVPMAYAGSVIVGGDFRLEAGAGTSVTCRAVFRGSVIPGAGASVSGTLEGGGLMGTRSERGNFTRGFSVPAGNAVLQLQATYSGNTQTRQISEISLYALRAYK